MYRVWPHQCHDWADFDGLRVGVMHGADKEKVLSSDDYDIYVINPEGLPWLFGYDGKAVDNKRVREVGNKFQMLIVDESTKFKTWNSVRFKLLKSVLKFFKRRYILTGSFRSKSLMDLFGQIYIVDEGAALGKYITRYRNAFFYPSGYGGYTWTPQPGAEKRVADKIAPLVYVINSEEGLDLPEVVFNDIWVDLPPAAMRQYIAMEELLMADIESGKVVAANGAVATGKCRQIANGILIHDGDEYTPLHDVKIEAVSELIEQLQGASALITYEFVADMDRLSDLGITCISTSNAKKDDENIQKFSNGMLDYVMGHPQSIALGIDGLQKNCADIIMVGLTWRLELYEQVRDRVRRRGNKKDTVTIHRILARNTIDERMAKLLERSDLDQSNFLQLLYEVSPHK